MSPPPLPGTAAAASQPDFIDVTAKLALVMAALSILYCVIQLGVVLAMGAAGAGSWLQTLELPIPAALQWLIEHAVLLSGLMLLFSLLFLAVSWGLLARREWARQGFIVVLVLTALANFAGLPLINAMFDAFLGIFPAELLQGVEGRELIAQLQISRWTSLIMLALTGLAFSALHGWLVVKLCRRQTRAQFH